MKKYLLLIPYVLFSLSKVANTFIDIDMFEFDEIEIFATETLYEFIHRTCIEAGIDVDIVIAMIFAENELLDPNPRSYNPNDIGFMQLNKGSFSDFEKYVGDHFDPYIVEHNVQAGIYHIRWLLMRKGVNENNIAQAYNQGIGNIWKETPPNHITIAHTERYFRYLNKIKHNKEYYIQKLNRIEGWQER